MNARSPLVNLTCPRESCLANTVSVNEISQITDGISEYQANLCQLRPRCSRPDAAHIHTHTLTHVPSVAALRTLAAILTSASTCATGRSIVVTGGTDRLLALQ